MQIGRPVAILIAGFLLAAVAHAQAILTLELGYSNPGARSLGFGGAFVALADDATAAYANPAGLVQLTRPEVSIEGRHWSYTTPFVLGGRASGAPTGIGIDTTSDLRWADSEADFTGLSFLSYVHPFKKWSVAIYRHQLVKFASAFSTNGLFSEGSTFLDTDRWIDQPGTADVEVVSWGFAVARRITDSFSLGLTLNHLEIDFDLLTTAYLPDDDSLAAFFGANSYRPERVAWRTSTQAHDTSEAVAFGFLWRIDESWSLGAFARSDFDAFTRWDGWPGPAASPENPMEWHFTGTWLFPAVLGLGCAYTSPAGHVTLSFEWDWVAYSEIVGDDPDEAIPDGHELHLGGEYAFLGRDPLLAIRAGIWLDPDHRIRATTGDDLFRAVLQPGTDEIHYAFGFGAAFERFQIDLGVDLSELRDTVSLSVIFSF